MFLLAGGFFTCQVFLSLLSTGTPAGLSTESSAGPSTPVSHPHFVNDPNRSCIRNPNNAAPSKPPPFMSRRYADYAQQNGLISEKVSSTGGGLAPPLPKPNPSPQTHPLHPHPPAALRRATTSTGGCPCAAGVLTCATATSGAGCAASHSTTARCVCVCARVCACAHGCVRVRARVCVFRRGGRGGLRGQCWGSVLCKPLCKCACL